MGVRSILARIAALALALAALSAFAFTGCTLIPNASIREDSVSDGLPEIDPEAGVAREIQVKLYYRLTGEAYLVGVKGTLTVQPGERAEKAMIRELISGVPPLSNNISSVIPSDTTITDVVPDGAILYVTLSDGFFDTSLVDNAEKENRESLATGFITQAEYEQRIAQAENEMYLMRRLAICSIVNSITEYDANVRVQLLFDTNGTGTGERVDRAELGFTEREAAVSDLMEPMEYQQDVVISPLTLASCALSRMMAGEYEKAYALFAETESGGLQKPAYASFETELLSLGRLTAYTLYSYTLSADGGEAVVHADIELTLPSGETAQYGGVNIYLKSEGNIYKLGYSALLELMKGGGE